MDRIFNCPKSVQLAKKYGYPVKKDTDFSTRGDELHKAAEKAILDGVKPPKEVAQYVALCREYIKRFSRYNIEETLQHKEYKVLFGTPDFYAYDRIKKHLYIVDLKAGQNIKVFVKENKQLMMYAWLWCSKYSTQPVKRVTLVVCQSALYTSPEIWSYGPTHLKKFDKMLEKLLTALIKGDNLKWKTGKHCMFCPVKSKCKKFIKEKNKDLISFLNKKGE